MVLGGRRLLRCWQDQDVNKRFSPFVNARMTSKHPSSNQGGNASPEARTGVAPSPSVGFQCPLICAHGKLCCCCLHNSPQRPLCIRKGHEASHVAASLWKSKCAPRPRHGRPTMEGVGRQCYFKERNGMVRAPGRRYAGKVSRLDGVRDSVQQDRVSDRERKRERQILRYRYLGPAHRRNGHVHQRRADPPVCTVTRGLWGCQPSAIVHLLTSPGLDSCLC